MRKYRKGKKIKSVAEYEESKSLFFMIHNKTTHKAWIDSFQYRTLKNLIINGVVYEADFIGGENECNIFS